MLEQISKLLKDRYRINEKHKLILAVSGGLDSVVMCDIFHKLNFEFAIAHVNFLLRAEQSNADENFVKELSKRYEVPFYLIRENAEVKAKEWKQSIQMAARKIRYDYFERLQEEFQYDYVLTAHHGNDSFETSLLNFIKSGSYSAIAGIPEINNSIIRPLLSFARNDIKTYAEENNLHWREDESNASLKYQRNIIRHKIIPVVEEINPSFLKTFSESGDLMHLLNFYLEMQLNEAKKDWIIEEADLIRVEIEHLLKKPSDILIFWEFLKQLGFNFQQFQDMVNSMNSESGKKFLSEEFICVKDRKHFLISRKEIHDEELTVENLNDTIHLGENTIIAQHCDSDLQIVKSEKIACLDADKLNYPLKLRPWKEGDKFQPLGMKGMKKVSDFLIDLKVPLNLKRKQYVLLTGDEIIWVVGRRINDKYRITEKTKKAIRFELI